MPILPLEVWLEGIVFVFGTICSVIVSCAGIAASAMAGLRAAPMTPVLRLLLEGIILCCLIAIAFFGVSTIYIAYDEVDVQRPVGGGSCSSPASSSIPSMSSELKSSMSVKSSTVAIKWVVGGNEFLRHLLPTQAGHSSTKGLMTRRETLMNLARRPRESAKRCLRR